MSSTGYPIHNQIPSGGYLSACGLPFQAPRTPARVSHPTVGAGIITPLHPIHVVSAIPRLLSATRYSMLVPPISHAAPALVTSRVITSVPAPSKWNGAGAIIVDTNYRRPSGVKCSSIFLFKNASSGMYELPYGKRDSTDSSAKKTAKRELEEESCNLFHFSEDMFDERYKVESYHGTQHAYIIKVTSSTGLFSKNFNKNLMLLKSSRAPHDYLEMSGITRIDIDDAICADIARCVDSPHHFTLKDVYGNSIIIHERDSRFIAKAIKNDIFRYSPTHNIRYIDSWNDRRSKSGKLYLDGTSSYI